MSPWTRIAVLAVIVFVSWFIIWRGDPDMMGVMDCCHRHLHTEVSR